MTVLIITYCGFTWLDYRGRRVRCERLVHLPHGDRHTANGGRTWVAVGYERDYADGGQWHDQ